MKKMTYTVERRKDGYCLHEEDYKNWKIVVITLGVHPCGYIGTKDKGNPYYKKSYRELEKDYNLYGTEVNGGFTYSEFEVAGYHKDYWFLGWDYAHAGDYTGYSLSDKGKKWKTIEIVNEARAQIDKLEDKKIKEEDE